ncbi:hypothetical protein [Aliarcobacter butzleri]|uniref:Uncharacterized protein n=3 Tax=Aliarcobacter butzleri TaxID=28197 RepID=A0A0G9JTI3_9BACT|nr:hypothetical protein [Aliarcobacter butzleri]KLD96888.1 hypothetical protein AA20_11390 [Aliarcobacter butzleri L348]KLD96909.1 hypothetical protein AA20_11380 [Aliarcobacter butzleri L348]KLD96911.1 hypothetical protein AA20_11355 [Aliarcobacter butzleri L348]KLD98406.1 hypothetical protein AA20_08785 [Aliarcobacter butzleri L348]
MENGKTCETLTKLDAKGIKKALMEFADFNMETRNEIFKIQRTLFHKLKEIHKDCDNETLSQSSLIISIREYIQSIPQEKREMQKFMKKFTKQAKKERMLLERWPRIRKAILEDKVSFRGLAIFLNEKYHIQVNHSYINKIWNKIEGDL